MALMSPSFATTYLPSGASCSTSSSSPKAVSETVCGSHTSRVHTTTVASALRCNLKRTLRNSDEFASNWVPSSQNSRGHNRMVTRMAPDEEKMTRRSPLDFPVEWERPAPGRRPDIFPSFSPIKPPLPQPLPGDPEEEDEDEEKEDEDPDKEPDQPEES